MNIQSLQYQFFVNSRKIIQVISRLSYRRKLLALALLSLVLMTSCTKTESADIRSAKDAEHARIAVVTGTSVVDIARERFPNAVIQEFNDFPDILAALKAGQTDVTITDINSALLSARRDPSLRVIEDVLREDLTAIAIKKGNDDLRLRINQIIRDMVADGTISDIDRRWLKREAGPYEIKLIPDPPAGKVPLRVAINATREPVAFVDDQGNITGHSAELARVIGNRLGRRVEFLSLRWDSLIPALESEKADLILSGMSITEERKKRVDFTDEYYRNKIVLLAKSVPSASINKTPLKNISLRSIDDLRTAEIGVVQGSAHDSYVQKNFPNAKLFQFISPSDLVLAVETERVTAGLIDEDPLRIIMREKPHLSLFGDSLFSFPVGAGFDKKNNALRAKFDAFIAKIKSDGTLKDMESRWMKGGSEQMPPITFDANAAPLKIGNAVVGLPGVTIKEGRPIGFDVELAERFAAHIGHKPEWYTVDWNALIPALAAGKIDTIISSMFITEERKQRINFSTPYYFGNNYFFVLSKNTKVEGENNAAASITFWDNLKDSFYSNIIHENRYLLLWDGLLITVALSIYSAIFGTFLGALICYARMSKHKFLSVPARIYISILRGTPVLVLLMLIFYVILASVPINPVMVAVIAFGLNFGAYTAEIFRSGIQGIDKGQVEAGIAMGFTKIKTFRYIVLPQLIHRILPVYKGEFISMVKMTSIVGYIAIQDLTKASDIIRSRTFDAFFPLFMIAILYFVISWLLLQFLEYLEVKTNPVNRRKIGDQA